MALEKSKEHKGIDKCIHTEDNSYSHICSSSSEDQILIVTNEGNSILSVNFPKCLANSFTFDIITLSEVKLLLKCLNDEDQRYSGKEDNGPITNAKNHLHFPRNNSVARFMGIFNNDICSPRKKCHRKLSEQEYGEIIAPTLGFVIKTRKRFKDERNRISIVVDCLYKLVQLFLMHISSNYDEHLKQKDIKIHRKQILRHSVRKFQKLLRILLSLKNNSDILNTVIVWIQNVIMFSYNTAELPNLKFLNGFLNCSVQTICNNLRSTQQSTVLVFSPLLNCVNILTEFGVPLRRLTTALISIYHWMKDNHSKDNHWPYSDIVYFLQGILQSQGESLTDNRKKKSFNSVSNQTCSV